MLILPNPRTYTHMNQKQNQTLNQLDEEGVLLNGDELSDDIGKNEPMFIDPWGHPILYYKASPSSRRIVGFNDKRGIYWQEDNAVITGSADGLVSGLDGLDFGAGADEHRDLGATAGWGIAYDWLDC